MQRTNENVFLQFSLQISVWMIGCYLLYITLNNVLPVDDWCHDRGSPGVLVMKVCPSTNLFDGQIGLVCPPIVEH